VFRITKLLNDFIYKINVALRELVAKKSKYLSNKSND